ncbi:thiamine phosphate synthase [Nocardioides sp. REDSEA-S30_B4]|uniref:thiamine phosphate synthase n=1 Tax=Nocardioides sp. REDSEA-S30_B4 TaxID=1811552 RepID=UPI000B31243D|nr:thiamine phosphate synthase [Nocardioides sp. REDSEA-S30_B4]
MSSHSRSAAVLPRVFCLVGPDDDLSLLPALAARGVTGFQVRDKTNEDRDCLALVVTVMASLTSYDVMVVVDDRLDVALATGADGGHHDGADYAGFGPIGVSGSKADLPDPLGVAALRGATGHLPLVALGGIDVPTAREVRAAGAHGVAVIGALWRARDPLRAAEELVAAVA